MIGLFEQHLRRIKAATTEQLQMSDLAVWVERNTTIGGRKFSFKNHEYQQRIMEDESREVVIRKCSQVGVSEMSIRMALGLAALMPSYAVLYTFPTAKFSSQYVQTRVDPVIEGSEYLRAAVSHDLNSSEIKRIGAYGYVYFKGAQSGNAAISVAGDHLIHDELDFSDQIIIGQYQSRLTHSPYKRKTKLSTPTLPGGPIDLAFQQSRRHFMFCKCDRCNHSFIPDYYEHVKIPGYDGDLRKISGDNLHTLRYHEAQLLCPRCGRAPSLQPEQRLWVIENPTEAFGAAGYQVSPFDAPNLILLPDLIESSTKYPKRTDFDNFGLGKPAEDADNGLTDADLEAAGITLDTSPFSTHCIGADMGLVCRLMVGNMTPDGEIVVVHVEEIPVGNFRRRYAELCRQYRVTSKVLDSMPYTETILSLQETDGGLFGAYFIETDRLELYKAVTREENIAEGKTPIRQVQVNRNKAFDSLMLELRGDAVEGIAPTIKIHRQDEDLWKRIKTQCTDMRRVRELSDKGEFGYRWVKSEKKNDHFHHALLYLWLAIKLRSVQHNRVGYGAGVPGVSTFKLKGPASQQRQGVGWHP